MGLLQRQLALQAASHNGLTCSDSNSSLDSLQGMSEDPLFSAATPPSVEQLQRKLLRIRRQLQQASSDSLTDVLTGGQGHWQPAVVEFAQRLIGAHTVLEGIFTHVNSFVTMERFL